jgi:Gram-negative bacterial TonB protein C-terminal
MRRPDTSLTWFLRASRLRDYTVGVATKRVYDDGPLLETAVQCGVSRDESMTRTFVLPQPPPLVSPGAFVLATATIGLIIAAVVWRPELQRLVEPRSHDTEGVKFLLPLLPPRRPPAQTDVSWLPSRFGNGAWGAGGQRLWLAVNQAVEAQADGGRRGRLRVHEQRRVVKEAGPDTTQGTVYIESQTDRPVERDPLSTGPIYPPWLEQNRIEGTVTASFVVDTTGYADSASLRIHFATLPAFADAVRGALPGMHFRPAELSGRHVRQLVEQDFRFVIAPPVVIPHPGLAPAPPPKTGNDSGV